jgi:multidrug efflux pump subunit AcrB
LTALHQHNLICSHYIDATQSQVDSACASRMALSSFARSSNEGAGTRLDDAVEGAQNSAPLVLSHFRDMAMLTLRFGVEDGKQISSLMPEISNLRKFLSVASEKWKLAGKSYKHQFRCQNSQHHRSGSCDSRFGGSKIRKRRSMN